MPREGGKPENHRERYKDVRVPRHRCAENIRCRLLDRPGEHVYPVGKVTSASEVRQAHRGCHRQVDHKVCTEQREGDPEAFRQQTGTECYSTERRKMPVKRDAIPPEIQSGTAQEWRAE